MIQQTLTGETIDGPACERCENREATRVLSLKRMTSDEMLLCDDCEFPEFFGATGGVESERELTAREIGERNDPA